VKLLVLADTFHFPLLSLTYLKTFPCHTFWESHSFHTFQNLQCRLTCTSSSPGFSRHLHVYIHFSFSALFKFNNTTSCLAHLLDVTNLTFLVTSELITARKIFGSPTLPTSIFTYGYLLLVTSRLVINFVYRSFGLCRHKREVLLISRASSLHFVLCEFVYVLLNSSSSDFLYYFFDPYISPTPPDNSRSPASTSMYQRRLQQHLPWY
jgi:hypothetical protein